MRSLLFLTTESNKNADGICDSASRSIDLQAQGHRFPVFFPVILETDKERLVRTRLADPPRPHQVIDF
jgi:hypothetical protein